ncbi:MAG: 30S ribosome-binding factor RbfA [Deltaproteobacteria bacterium]|nr:30S ribosome-binding factor RbfA [Deltaproteobacteria bacterium]
MKPFSRQERVGALVRRKIAEILAKELKDPRLGPVTVTGVRMTTDLKVARVYYTVREGDPALKRGADRAFASARGFIKKEMGQDLKLRYMPRLEFFYDESIDRGERIEKLLKQTGDTGAPGEE